MSGFAGRSPGLDLDLNFEEFPIALGPMIRYISGMKRTETKYVVGNRPPQDLSPEAKAQLDRGHRSQVMEEMVQKASKGNVTIQLNKEYFLSVLAASPRKKLTNPANPPRARRTKRA